jgi:hypothetical protein
MQSSDQKNAILIKKQKFNHKKQSSDQNAIPN